MTRFTQVLRKVWVRVQKTSDGRVKKLHTDITVTSTDAQLTAVKQVKSAELTATLSAEVDNVKPADFQVVRDESKAVIPVKDAKLGDDKKTVTITTYAELKDSKEHTVTYTNPKVMNADKQKSEAKFTATNGVIASVSLTADTITVGKERVHIIKSNTNNPRLQ